jgi:hypothetical protein
LFVWLSWTRRADGILHLPGESDIMEWLHRVPMFERQNALFPTAALEGGYSHKRMSNTSLSGYQGGGGTTKRATKSKVCH